MRPVKFVVPFLILSAFSFSACNTLVDRRDLYAPTKASGPYTEARKTGSWRHGKYPQPHAERKTDDAPKPVIDTTPADPAPAQ